MWMEVNIILYQTLAKKNGVLVVISSQVINPISGFLPRASHVLAGRRTVCDYFAGLMVTFNTIGFWFVAVIWLLRMNLVRW